MPGPTFPSWEAGAQACSLGQEGQQLDPHSGRLRQGAAHREGPHWGSLGPVQGGSRLEVGGRGVATDD